LGEFELIRRCFDWNSGAVDSDTTGSAVHLTDSDTTPLGDDTPTDSTHRQPKNQSNQQDPSTTQLLLGIGDDAALIKSSAVQAICTDSLIEDTHFVLDTSSELIGYKSLAVNLSDLAAMGASPTLFLLAIGLPGNSKHFDQDAWLSGFARGLKRCANEFGVRLIGGDTTRSPQISITITALGECASPLKRSSLKPGMRLAVSGSLGGPALALKNQELTQPNALNQPTPRVSLGLALGRQQQAGSSISCIDISDGLLQDLSHLLEQSCDQLGLSNQTLCAGLELDCLPAHESIRGLEAQTQIALMLTGGEDYELLIGYDPNLVDLSILSQQTGVALTDIGEITLKAQSGTQAQPPINSVDGGSMAQAQPDPLHAKLTAKPWQITATLHACEYSLPNPADWGFDHFKPEQQS
jgi:thiamine-monophosphate kinase